MAKFKVGDKVRVKPPCLSSHEGMVGTVEKVGVFALTGADEFHVKFGDGKTERFNDNGSLVAANSTALNKSDFEWETEIEKQVKAGSGVDVACGVAFGHAGDNRSAIEIGADSKEEMAKAFFKARQVVQGIVQRNRMKILREKAMGDAVSFDIEGNLGAANAVATNRVDWTKEPNEKKFLSLKNAMFLAKAWSPSATEKDVLAAGMKQAKVCGLGEADVKKALAELKAKGQLKFVARNASGEYDFVALGKAVKSAIEAAGFKAEFDNQAPAIFAMPRGGGQMDEPSVDKVRKAVSPVFRRFGVGVREMGGPSKSIPACWIPLDEGMFIGGRKVALNRAASSNSVVRNALERACGKVACNAKVASDGKYSLVNHFLPGFYVMYYPDARLYTDPRFNTGVVTIKAPTKEAAIQEFKKRVDAHKKKVAEEEKKAAKLPKKGDRVLVLQDPWGDGIKGKKGVVDDYRADDGACRIKINGDTHILYYGQYKKI